MKKIFSILIPFAALSLLASCQQELIQPDVSSDKVILKDPVPGDMAEVIFTVSVPDAGVSYLSTKALEEQPHIGEENGDGDIYLALFGLGNNNTQGRGGNLQHFLKAKLIESAITHDLTGVDNGTTTTHKYRYAVLLPISEEPFVVDFMVGASDPDGNLYTLDNPPTVQYEADFMPGMLSRDGAPGYWQRIVIPKVEAEYANGSPVPSSEHNPDNYTAKPIQEMQDIQLVRNFAMVTFTSPETAKFTINRFFLVDYPKYGDIAPFDASNTVGYKTPYMTATDYASISGYIGYSTNKTLEPGIDVDDPDPTYTASGEYSFLYERPAPSDEMLESGAVIEVTWKNSTDVEAALRGQTRYYKVAFTGASGYVPILRNIAYNFEISDFKSPSHPTTAADAYNGSWLGDISANVATANLDEIANSVSRIVVSEMSKTHIGAETTEPYSIYFQYYPDTQSQSHGSEVAVVNGTNFYGKNVKVVASIEAVSGYGPAIKSITQPVADTEYSSGSTWGRVDVQTYGSGEAILRSKLKILCQLEGQTALYREVIFTVMQKQLFNNGVIDSSIDVVEDAIGKQTILHLRIPSDLPKDLFPLQVRIESQANNLTSIPFGTGENKVDALPVKYGLSAFDNSKSSYYFVKTINWDDYAHLNGETYSYTTEFPCYFKTTLDEGNTTKISLQDLTATKTNQVNTGKFFYEMQLDLLSEGISVSPEIQLINHDVTSATVHVAASSTWQLGAHEGLTVASGSPTFGEAGSYDITFNFSENNTQSHQSYTATFTMGSLSATATIEQTALVTYTRSINTTSGTFTSGSNGNYGYTGDYASEVGIAFNSAYSRGGSYITLNKSGSTISFTANKITRIDFTWNGNTPNSANVVSGGGSTTTASWTNSSGSDSVEIGFTRTSGGNSSRPQLQRLSITYALEQ